MSHNVIIIGAVALGPKAACRLKRLEPESHVILLDQSDMISYGGCGIPYFVSGDVSDPSQLLSTSFNMVRDENFFRDAKDIEVMTNTRAVSIDRERKTVLVENIRNGHNKTLHYDKMVLATGSLPRRLPIEGVDLQGVFTVSTVSDAIAIKTLVAEGKVGNAVVIGAGPIGLEMAEALSDLWGVDTSVVEIEDQIMPGIVGENIAYMATEHMKENGVTFYLKEKVLSIEGDGTVRSVTTDKRNLDTDLVIMAVGVQPNSDLARNAGLNISPSGAIVVNEKMQTSDENIFAGGDCVELKNLVTGTPGFFPYGSMANRQGRVIGTNLAGGNDTFEGAVGSHVVKLFDISVAGAGISHKSATDQRIDAVSAFVVQFDRAHFFPEKDLMYLELVVEKPTGRVLGIQGLGNKGDGMVGRIDAVASILKYRPSTKDISNLELAYSPPFSAAMDILNALGNTAENILKGKNRVIDVAQFKELWMEREKGKTCFLDCRGWQNAEPFVKKHPDHWKSIPQDELRSRIHEVPRDREIVLICNTGVRSYEAQITLDQAGIKRSYNLQGGMAAVKKWNFEI